MALNERIRELRKAQGLSQEGLARRADVSLGLINRLEMGRITDPHYSTMLGLVDALGMDSIDELLGEEQHPKATAPSSGQRSSEEGYQVVATLPLSDASPTEVYKEINAALFAAVERYGEAHVSIRSKGDGEEFVISVPVEASGAMQAQESNHA